MLDAKAIAAAVGNCIREHAVATTAVRRPVKALEKGKYRIADLGEILRSPNAGSELDSLLRKFLSL